MTDLVAARWPYIGGRWAAGEGGEFAAAITPYNFPFITNVWKIVPALLAGAAGIRAFRELKHVVVGGR